LFRYVTRQLITLSFVKIAYAEKFRTNIPINDFFTKATSLALHDVPIANVKYVHDKINQLDAVNISVATVTHDVGAKPFAVKNADKKGLLTISELTKELTEKARDGDFISEEYKGGTFR
jgi:pyruvate/2-oxoglutarate dehydrogenase complex dihydrolipoamide acyltransferase (E2) component